MKILKAKKKNKSKGHPNKRFSTKVSDNWALIIKPNLEKIEQWRREGYSITSICQQLNISESSFYENKQRRPEFAERLSRALESCEDRLRSRAYDIALGRVQKVRTVKGKTDKGEVDYEEKVDFEHPDRMIMALLRHEHKWTDTHKPEPETPQLTAKELEMAMATALGLSEFVNRDKVAKIKGLTAEKVRETIRFSVEIDNGEKETEGAVFGEAVGDSLPEVPDSEE